MCTALLIETLSLMGLNGAALLGLWHGSNLAMYTFSLCFPMRLTRPAGCLSQCSWAYQVAKVQRQINDEPASALGGTMTRSQALYGALPHSTVTPTVAFLAELLQFKRSVG
jgi:hypothetical protein